MAIHFEIFVIALLVPIAFATEGFRECPGIPLPNSLEVSGCDKAPCILQRGEDVLMTAHFTTIKSADSMTTKVHFKEVQSGIAGQFPLTGNKGKTCEWLEGADCPIYENEDVAFSLEMPVLTIYPKNMELDLKIWVENENKEELTCFQLRAKTSG